MSTGGLGPRQFDRVKQDAVGAFLWMHQVQEDLNSETELDLDALDKLLAGVEQATARMRQTIASAKR